MNSESRPSVARRIRNDQQRCTEQHDRKPNSRFQIQDATERARSQTGNLCALQRDSPTVVEVKARVPCFNRQSTIMVRDSRNCLDTPERPRYEIAHAAAVEKHGFEPRTDLGPKRVIDHRPRSVTAPVQLDHQTQDHSRQRLMPDSSRFSRPNPIGLLNGGSCGPADERPFALATLGGGVVVGITAIRTKFHEGLFWSGNAC
jgi:hypothetical protein